MKTVVLFNLNSYLGGGEVLVVRLAEQLKLKGQQYKVICVPDSYIHKECRKKELKYECWSISSDSILYMNRKEKKETIEFMTRILKDIDNPLIYTFCFRDVYNILFLKGKIHKKIFIGTGIYHPDDTKYVATRTIHAKRNRMGNRYILQQYCDKDSAVFMNERVYISSCVTGSSYILIPLPIKRENVDNIATRRECRNKILWIGRFVDFKLSAIMEIIRFVEDNPEFSLTILGYGTEEKIIRRYVQKRQLENVTLIGKTDPTELKAIIREYDIGYVMGTSVLECASQGMPVIKAAVMPKKMATKRNDICAGIFGEVPNYDVGEVDLNDQNAFFSLQESVLKIQNDYEKYCHITNEFIKKFDLCVVVDSYVKMWEKADLQLEEINVKFPHISCVRYIIKRILYKRIIKKYNG